MRVLSAVRIDGDVERRRRVRAKQRRAKNVRLFLGDLGRNKAD